MIEGRTKDRRKGIPMGVKLQCALVALAEALGLDSDTQFEFDHTPALGLRDWNEEAQDYEPPQNDPAFIVCRPVDLHDIKTFGTKATTAGSDIHLIAKGKRLRKDGAEHAQVMLAKIGLADMPERKPSRLQGRGFPKDGPKQKIPSRPFPKRKKQIGAQP